MQQSFVSSSATSLTWRGSCAWEISTDSSKISNRCSWRRQKKNESQCVLDEKGRLLRDKGRIRERGVRFFRSLLNAKSDMLDPDIPKRLPKHSVASALGIEPTEEAIATAIKATANVKAVGPDALPTELQKLGP